MSVRLKTIIGVACIEAILLVILIGNNLVDFSAQSELELISRAKTASSLFATISKDAIISSDIASLEDYVKEFTKNEGVVYARILSGKKVLASYGTTSHLNAGFQEDYVLSKVDDSVFDTYKLIEEADAEFAKVEVGLSTASVEKALQDARSKAIGIGLVGLVLSALFSFLLGTFLTKKLNAIRRAARKISEGDYDINLKVVGTDELADTAYAFNIMSSSITQYIEKIQIERRAAEQANTAKSHFLANMSHEIRTPLNAIIAMSSVITKENHNHPSIERIKTIQNASELLLAQVNDVLDISKIEAGEFSLENRAVDLHELINSIKEIYMQMADDKKLNLLLTVDMRIPRKINLDELRFKQVVSNLVSNAIKFTEKGSIELIVSALELTDTHVEILIAISDTGIGIPKEKQSQIVKAFGQADISTTRQYGGTGLGLTICTQILEQMGSSLKISSCPGLGCRMSFSFETTISQGSYAEEINCQTIEDIKQLNILICEDNEMNQTVMEAILSSLGHKFEFANDGKEGLELFSSKEYDLIFMDFQMPIMDGLEAARRMRDYEQQNSKEPIKIIAMTANAVKNEVEKAMKYGMNDYISKPVTLQQVESCIKENASEFGTIETKLISSQPTQQDSDASIDMQAINGLKELNPNENFAFLRKQIKAILHKLEPTLESIYKSISEEDSENIKFHSHKFKTSCGIVGAKILWRYLDEIEDKAMTPKVFTNEYIKKVDIEAKNVKLALRTIICELEGEGISA